MNTFCNLVTFVTFVKITFCIFAILNSKNYGTYFFFLVFEEIIMQIGTIEESLDSEGAEDAIVYWEQPMRTRCQALGAQCDSQGRFNSKQCDEGTCWCVDEAGNQLPLTNSFKDGEQLCRKTIQPKLFSITN